MSKVRLAPGLEFEAASKARRAGSAQDGPAAEDVRTPTGAARRGPAEDGAAEGLSGELRS